MEINYIRDQAEKWEYFRDGARNFESSRNRADDLKRRRSIGSVRSTGRDLTLELSQHFFRRLKLRGGCCRRHSNTYHRAGRTGGAEGEARYGGSEPSLEIFAVEDFGMFAKGLAGKFVGIKAFYGFD